MAFNKTRDSLNYENPFCVLSAISYSQQDFFFFPHQEFRGISTVVCEQSMFKRSPKAVLI